MENIIPKGMQHLAEDSPAQDPLGINKAALRQMGKGELIREIVRLTELLDKADMMALVKQRQDARKLPMFTHREAFALVTYRSEGGTEVLRTWNSRDGVVPGICYVNGMMFIAEPIQAGPFFDRPEECDAQWETRTVKQMMEAWERSLNRAALQGKIDAVRKFALIGDVEAAKSHHLHIGLRDLATGKFTDDF